MPSTSDRKPPGQLVQSRRGPERIDQDRACGTSRERGGEQAGDVAQAGREPPSSAERADADPGAQQRLDRARHGITQARREREADHQPHRHFGDRQRGEVGGPAAHVVAVQRGDRDRARQPREKHRMARVAQPQLGQRQRQPSHARHDWAF
jgi:hypothetical protein